MPRTKLLQLAVVIVFVGCSGPPKFNDVILSYSEKNTFCWGCPQFRVDFSDGGHVNYYCLASCAVPGKQHHLVPEQRFRDLVEAFHGAGFFGIARIDRTRMVVDVPVVTLTYRDDQRIHEVIDVERHLPKISDLENRIKTATDVERYLKPSLALYRRLVDSGWNINTLGPDRQNALFSAVIFRDDESARFLLDRGSSVTDETFEAATLNDNPDIFRLLVLRSKPELSGSRGAAILAMAARRGKAELVNFLLDLGAPANPAGSAATDGPLVSAIPGGSLETARLLLDRGADAGGRDRNGQTALWYAAGEDPSFIALLLEHGADVNARNQWGQTALMHAAELCRTRNIQMLLEAGADPAIADKRGRTAFVSVSPAGPGCAAARQMLENAAREWPHNR